MNDHLVRNGGVIPLIISFYIDENGDLHQQSAMDVTSEALCEFRDQAPSYTTIKVPQDTGVLSAIAKHLWQKLGHVACDDDGTFEDVFLHFKTGTCREDVWHWFEETFDLSVHSLMFPESKS